MAKTAPAGPAQNAAQLGSNLSNLIEDFNDGGAPESDVVGLGTNIPPIKTTTVKAAPKLADAPTHVKIVLDDNDEIPPTGLFLGLNGRGYLIRPGEEVRIPIGVREILDHAIISTPQVDPVSRRVVGHRQRHKYSYRVVA